MKKLSLVAILALTSTQAFCADTLADAFAAGKVSGEIKSQYFQKKNDAGQANIWTNGGNLSYVTGDFYGFNAGATFQVASVTADDLDNRPTAFNSDQNVSGAILSQSYIGYKASNTSVKAGRQFISTPLVEGSGSRIFKESFEGVVVANTDIPNTTLVAAYVNKFQGRTDVATGGSDVKATSDFTDSFVVNGLGTVELDGAYTVYLKNTSVKDLTLEAQYAQANVKASSNDATIFYATASYNLKPFTFEGQTYQTDNSANTNSDGQAYAVNVMANIDKLSLGAAYSIVTDDANVISGLGNGADYLYTYSEIYGGIYDADTDAYKLSAGYALTSDLSFDLVYAAWKTGTADRASETDYVAKYKFNKELSTKFVLATYNNTSEDYRSRLYVSYKF